MKYLTQLITFTLAFLLFASNSSANPVVDLEVREAAAGPAPVLVGDARLSSYVHLEKRKKGKGSSSSNSTSDAINLTPGGALGVAGLAVFAIMA